MQDHGHRKPVLILPNALSKPGERAKARQKLIFAVGEIRTYNLWQACQASALLLSDHLSLC